jgi:hypothetical protein
VTRVLGGAVGLLVVFMPTVAFAQWQWVWPPASVYGPYERISAPRTHHKLVVKLKPKPKPKPKRVKERHITAMSADMERAWLQARVKSFCGRHPADVACLPQPAEAPKE